MRVDKINLFSYKPVSKSGVVEKQNTNSSSKGKTIGIVAGVTAVAALAIAGICHVKNKHAISKPAQNGLSTALADGVESLRWKELKERIPSVMDKKEFLQAVSKLKKENYVASKENIEKGIFRADLHSHSLYSDGRASVENILNQVCKYADKLKEKTGENFIFSLTDHDGIGGVREALKLISEYPEKFKNVRFVTGSEISYLIKADKTANPCETQELLVYGFNPFSESVKKFFDNVKSKRKEMVSDYIVSLSKLFPETKFSEEELTNVFLKDKESSLGLMNSYWQVYHYGQIKTVLSDTAKAKGLNPETYFAEVMKKAPRTLNLYEFKKAGLVEGWINENPKITELNKKYLPEIDLDGKIISKSENLLEEFLSAFKEEDCVAGFAHPYYLAERTTDAFGVINEVKSKMGNMLGVTESYHQAYGENILNTKIQEIERINSLCEKENTIPIGGRDNHNVNWLEDFAK